MDIAIHDVVSVIQEHITLPNGVKVLKLFIEHKDYKNNVNVEEITLFSDKEVKVKNFSD